MKIKIFKNNLFIIIYLFLSYRMTFCQYNNQSNFYLNQDNYIISISLKDTLITTVKDSFIIYTENNLSKGILLRKCLFNKNTKELKNAYYISNDYTDKFYIYIKNDSTYFRKISKSDTSIIRMVHKKNIYPIALIKLIVLLYDIKENEKMEMDFYIIDNIVFSYKLEYKGLEQIKINDSLYTCNKINIDAKGFLASRISPDINIWYDKINKRIIKYELSDFYLIIRNNFSKQ